MANTSFYVPELRDAGAWQDGRSWHGDGYTMFGNRALSDVRKLIVHHSVTSPTGNARDEVATLARIHMNQNGWPGIGYNFAITTEEVNGLAVVVYVGDIGSVRAHSPNRKGADGIPANMGNRYALGSVFIGRHDGDFPRPMDHQLRSMNLLANELGFNEDARLPNLHNDWNDFLRAHKDWDWTACPGDYEEYRQMIITPPVIPGEQPPQEPERWQDRDFRQEQHTFTVKGPSLSIKNFDTLEVIDVVPRGTEITTHFVSNDNRWYASQWALDNHQRHGFLIEDVQRDQAIEEYVAPPEDAEPTPAPDLGVIEPVVIPENRPTAPVPPVVVVPEPQEQKTATKDAAKTLGKYLGPSGVATVATLTAWQQWLSQVPAYVWIILFVLLNIFLIVLYNKSPKFNKAVNRLVDGLLVKIGIK